MDPSRDTALLSDVTVGCPLKSHFALEVLLNLPGASFALRLLPARHWEISEVTDRYNPNQKVTIRKPIEREITLEPDGDSHSYQILGTWSGRSPEEMTCEDGAWTFEITLGENRWESFYLLQDNDAERRIVPNVSKATKEAVPVGPLSTGPKHALVWVDCEMTGLGAEGGPGPDTLLEVAVLITDDHLRLVAEGPDVVVHHSDEVLDGMNDWCKRQFGWDDQQKIARPGLLADQADPTSEDPRSRWKSLKLGKNRWLLWGWYVEEKGGILAGNTVHMDKRFLDKFCPKFVDCLHYRIVDVSTVKELCRRWYPEQFSHAPKKKELHRAMDDIRESLKDPSLADCAELAFYKEAAQRDEWLLDCRARVNVPEEQVGLPGDKYRVTFRWDKLKEISWEKLDAERAEVPQGKYYLTGPFNEWNLVEMQIDTTGPRRRRKGWFSTEVEVSTLAMEFCVVRNEDFTQTIHPEVLPGQKVSQHSAICGPDDGEGTWKIEETGELNEDRLEEGDHHRVMEEVAGARRRRTRFDYSTYRNAKLYMFAPSPSATPLHGHMDTPSIASQKGVEPDDMEELKDLLPPAAMDTDAPLESWNKRRMAAAHAMEAGVAKEREKDTTQLGTPQLGSTCAMAKISVTVQKMTGEEKVIEANPQDTVSEIQNLVARDMGVPHLCQKLWINNATVSMMQRSIPGMGRKMEKLIASLNTRLAAEVKAFAKPPVMVMKMMIIVKHLLQFKEDGWAGCKVMMRDVKAFYEALQQWHTTVQDVRTEQVEKAQKIADELAAEGKWSREYFDRCSLLCGVLYDWVVLAFQMHKMWHNPGNVTAIEMEGFHTLDTYLGDDGDPKIQVTLVADYSVVFQHLDAGTQVDDALDTLEVIAEKCPEKSMPALARYLRSDTERFRQKSLKAVKNVFQKGDLSVAEALAQHLENFYQNESEEALEALEHLGPSNRRAMKCIITGMNCKRRQVNQYQPRRKIKRVKPQMKYDDTDDSHAFRELCLEIFKTVEPEADTQEVIDDVMEAALDGGVIKLTEGNVAEVVQKEVLDALAIVAPRNYDYALSLVLNRIKPSDGRPTYYLVSIATKAASGFAQKEDPKLLEALEACAQNEEMGWEMPHLMLVAESYQQISASASPFVATILRQLGDAGSDEARAIDVLAKLAPEGHEEVIKRMQRYLSEAHDYLHYDGPAVPKAALHCLEQVVSEKSVAEKAYEKLINVLIHRCCGSIAASGMKYDWVKRGRKPSVTHKFLLEVAEKHGGVKNIQLWNIASGFSSTITDVRFESLRIFKTISKSPEAQPVFVALKVLEENFSACACCAAIDALPHTAPPDLPEVTDRLLLLLQSPECTVKTAALEALAKYSSPKTSFKDPAVKCLGDGDPFVRRAALKLLIQLELLQNEDVDGVLSQCLADSSSDVVLMTLENLPGMQLSQEVLGKAAEFMDNADPMLRLEAKKLCSEYGAAAFKPHHVWPETDKAVRGW
eukprot:s1960_g2.t2